MVNPVMPEHWTLSLGESCDILGERYGISREEQDALALASHLHAHEAWESGVMDDEIVKIPGAELERDECIRHDTTISKLAALKPVFRTNGTVTAGNSSPLNDGAALLVLGDEKTASRMGISSMARIAGRAAAGVDPDAFGIGPVEAANKAMHRAGIGWGELSVVELNEAFAVQALACLRDWPELDPTIVNPNGGAIAIGHPLGASGARILGSLAREMRRRGGRWGLAAICIGVGQGLAVVLEAA
jgi:acetyl-CoA acyltransferase